MDQFLFYFNFGLNHVLDINGLDHFFFLVALVLPFGLSDWKKVLRWVTLFTLGHTFSLLAAYEQWITISGSWVEFLISTTIAITCVSIFFREQHSRKCALIGFATPITLVFGLIHGLGFARYFSQIVLNGTAYTALVEFALGVEVAQIIIVSLFLIVNYFVLNILKLSKIKWEWIIASMILSQVIVMMYNNFPL